MIEGRGWMKDESGQMVNMDDRRKRIGDFGVKIYLLIMIGFIAQDGHRPVVLFCEDQADELV